MTFLPKNKLRNTYNSGKILENRANRKYVRIFSLCSFHFTTNKKRALKKKQYDLDNANWLVHNKDQNIIQVILTKLKMIITGEATRIKGKSYHE